MIDFAPRSFLYKYACLLLTRCLAFLWRPARPGQESVRERETRQISKMAVGVYPWQPTTPSLNVQQLIPIGRPQLIPQNCCLPLNDALFLPLIDTPFFFNRVALGAKVGHFWKRVASLWCFFFGGVPHIELIIVSVITETHCHCRTFLWCLQKGFPSFPKQSSSSFSIHFHACSISDGWIFSHDN